MASDKAVRSRRRYDRDLKAQVLAECAVPGASVAKIAMAHGINANVVHRWRQLARKDWQETAVNAGEFVPVAMSPATSREDGRGIEIELRRGAVTINLIWPMNAASELAAWMRELLR